MVLIANWSCYCVVLIDELYWNSLNMHTHCLNIKRVGNLCCEQVITQHHDQKRLTYTWNTVE